MPWSWKRWPRPACLPSSFDWVNRLQEAAQAQKLPAADGKGTATTAEIVDGLLPLAKQKLLNFEAKGELYPERLRRPKPVDPIPTFVKGDSKEVSKQLDGIESLKPWSIKEVKAMVTYRIDDEGHVVKPNTGGSKADFPKNGANKQENSK